MKSFLDKNWLALSSFIILFYTLLMGIQGFDLTDEGFTLVAYQNFFENTAKTAYFFAFYLTEIVGGFWNFLFGYGGWYSFRVFNAIIIVCSYLLICITLRDYWKYKWYIFAAFMIVVSQMIQQHGMLVFHYYTFSAFTGCLITYLFYKGFKDKKGWAVFVGSIICGLNVFVRIPNITLWAIPFVLLIVEFCYFHSKKLLYSNAFLIAVGFISGVGAVVALMMMLGHWGFFVDSIKMLQQAGANTKGTHGIVPMMIVNALNFLWILILMIVLSFVFIINKLNDKMFPKGPSMWMVITYIVLFSLVIYGVSTYGRYGAISYLLAFSYLAIAYTIKKGQYGYNDIILMAISLLISVLQPLGSDYGIGNMGAYSVWLVLPVAVIFLVKTISKGKKEMMFRPIQLFLFVFLAISLAKWIYFDSIKCYRDEGDRFSKVYRIKSSSKATVYTNKERAESYNEMIQASRRYLKVGDEAIIAYDKPGIYYLMNVKPFLSNPWLMIYEAGQLEKILEYSYENREKPVIIENHFTVADSSEVRYISNIKSLHHFLKRSKYKVVWRNREFTIYK